MTVLIATSDSPLAHRCEDALASTGRHWARARSRIAAEASLQAGPIPLVLLDLGRGAIAQPLGLCLVAAYRWPQTRILILLGDGLRPDGSLMALCPNVAAYLPRGIAEDDLAAIAAHHADPGPRAPAATHPALHLRH